MPARYAHRAAATAGLALIAVASPSASTCFVPPLETSVSGATLIFRGTVAKVDYFARDAGDRVPAAQGSLCGPTLVTAEYLRQIRDLLGGSAQQ